MKDMSLRKISRAISETFVRYNLTIFIVVLVSGLGIAVLMLNQILQESSDTTGLTSTTNITTFDQETIDRVRQLHTSSEELPVFSLPTGRNNPFAE